jgi:ribosomal protein S18 acetylase RimI-like enzyme
MSEVTIRPLHGPDDLYTFNQFTYDLDGEYIEDLKLGRRRPGWMWLALRQDALVARAAWWGRPGAETPLLMDVFDIDSAVTDRHDIAFDLVRTALDAMNLTGSPPEYGRYLPAGWRHDPDEVARVADRAAVIERLGGQVLVERLRLQWGPDGVVPTDRHRLSFRPPEDRGELLGLLTGVLENTLDEHSRNDLRTMTAQEVATAQLDSEFPRYSGPRKWWAVGCLPDGEPVGFVIPTRNDYSWIIAYIGILPRHRGRRYVDELLDHGTRTLAGAGADIIKASTDLGNAPMAAAFRGRGYPTVGEEIDYQFHTG